MSKMMILVHFMSNSQSFNGKLLGRETHAHTHTSSSHHSSQASRTSSRWPWAIIVATPSSLSQGTEPLHCMGVL